MYAGLQSTLHNAHFKQPFGGFKPAMWLPGWVDPAPDAKQARIISMAHISRPATPDETAMIDEQNRIFQDRARRAHEAQARGAEKSEVQAIMNGETYGG